MGRLSSPTTKPQILANIVRLWKTESKSFSENPTDAYQKGRYAMMLDILKAIEIYDKGGKE